jgi:hypothetical protein
LFRFTIIRERLIGINREKQAEGIEIIQARGEWSRD